jgi:hypothetical protein
MGGCVYGQRQPRRVQKLQSICCDTRSMDNVEEFRKTFIHWDCSSHVLPTKARFINVTQAALMVATRSSYCPQHYIVVRHDASYRTCTRVKVRTRTT